MLDLLAHLVLQVTVVLRALRVPKEKLALMEIQVHRSVPHPYLVLIVISSHN